MHQIRHQDNIPDFDTSFGDNDDDDDSEYSYSYYTYTYTYDSSNSGCSELLSEDYYTNDKSLSDSDYSVFTYDDDDDFLTNWSMLFIYIYFILTIVCIY